MQFDGEVTAPMALRTNMEVLSALDVTKMECDRFNAIATAKTGLLADEISLDSLLSRGVLIKHRSASVYDASLLYHRETTLLRRRNRVYSPTKLALVCLAQLASLSLLFMAFSLISISTAKPGDQGQIQFLADKEAAVETLIMSIRKSNFSVTEANSRDRDLDFMRFNFHDYPSGVCNQSSLDIISEVGSELLLLNTCTVTECTDNADTVLDRCHEVKNARIFFGSWDGCWRSFDSSRDSYKFEGSQDKNVDSPLKFDHRWRPWYLNHFDRPSPTLGLTRHGVYPGMQGATSVKKVVVVLLDAGASMRANIELMRQYDAFLSRMALVEDGIMKPPGTTQIAMESTARGLNFNRTGPILESFSSSFKSTTGLSQLKNWVSRPECVPNSGPNHSPNHSPNQYPPHPNRTVELSRALTIAVAMILVAAVTVLLNHYLINLRRRYILRYILDSSHRYAPSTHDDVDISSNLNITGFKNYLSPISREDARIAPAIVSSANYENEANLQPNERNQQTVQVTRSKHSQRDPSDVTSPTDDLMNTLAPLFMTQMKDALEPVLGPVISALQNQGEEERMQRQKLIAQEEKKLALKREEVQRLKRRRACRFLPTRSARATNSSAKSPQLTLRQGLRLQLQSPPR